MTDTTQSELAVSAEDDGLPILHATKDIATKGSIKGHFAAFAVLMAVCVFHIGIGALFNLLETASIESPAPEVIPVELVTEPPVEKNPPSLPKSPATDTKTQGAEKAADDAAAKAQEKAQREKAEQEKAEKEKAEKAQEKPQEKPEENTPKTPPQTSAAAPEPPKPAPEPPKPEPQKPAPEPPKPAQEPAKPEAQRTDLQKPAKADTRKPAPQPAKTSSASRGKQAPRPQQEPLRAQQEPPRTQAVSRPDQPKQTANAVLPPTPFTQQLPSLPMPFNTSPENLRAIAVPETSEDGEDTLSYQTIVFSRLELAKHFPQAALARGAHGVAGIGFTLDNAGNVLDVELLVPSGDPDLDEESVALVHRAAPFPPPPPGAQTRVTAVVTFDSPPHQ